MFESIKTESLQANVFEKINAGRKERFSLKMAPMIDIIFLLLIFFLVAAKWRPQENFLPFQLPTANAGTIQAKPEPLVIKISSESNGCQVQIGQTQTVAIEEKTVDENLLFLLEELNNCLTVQKRYVTDPVEIDCDQDVKWEYIAKIYNILFGAGITDITFQIAE